MSTKRAPMPRLESKRSVASRSGSPTRARSTALGTFSTHRALVSA